MVFGSFTEDETRSWLQMPSSEKDEKLLDKKELQFGSLNCAGGITFGDFSCESSRPLGCSSGEVSFQTKNSPKKENVSPAKKADDLPSLLEGPKQNRIFDNFSYGNSTSNGVKDFKTENLSSLHLSQNEDSDSNQSFNSKFHLLDIGSIEDGNLEKTNNASQVSLKKEENQKPIGAHAPATAIRKLLSRGLINSGNLWFLNATLQALVSCSPFVQLLQDLRNRNIPKVGFPTITAFSQFTSDLDMPSSSSLKKDTAVVETGRPFSPAMFEGVLKNFSPDVPNSMLGQPRR